MNASRGTRLMNWLNRPYEVPALSIWALTIMGIGLGMMVGVTLPRGGVHLTIGHGQVVLWIGLIMGMISGRYWRAQAAKREGQTTE